MFQWNGVPIPPRCGAMRVMIKFKRSITRCARALTCASVVAFAITASAQDAARHGPQSPPANFDLFGAIGRWIDESFAKLDSNLQDTRKNIDHLTRDAAVAARTTADVAKEAADAMVSLPNTRVISGHQNCPLASNGAPNCIDAAIVLCKS